MRNPGQASSEPSVVRPICTIRTQSIPAIASQKLIHQMSRKVCRAPIRMAVRSGRRDKQPKRKDATDRDQPRQLEPVRDDSPPRQLFLNVEC